MVELFFVEAIYEGEISVSVPLKKYLQVKKPKTLALFASVQFAQLDNFRKEIEKIGIRIKTTKAKRTAKPLQILGCDSYGDSFAEDIMNESDMILYVGDGLFHPKALLLAQTGVKKIKPIVLYDPIAQTVKEISYKDIEKQLLRAKANIRKFMNANSIGILVTIKPGQQYFNLAKQLKEKLHANKKRAYIFIDNTIDLKSLENYPFIQAWVNTACPRIGSDDIVTITQPMINIREAFEPVKALEMLEK